MNCSVLLILCVIISGALSGNWHYGDESHWPETCRKGEAQSPINLDEQESVKKTFEKFKFRNYDVEHRGIIKNNGHSVQLTLQPGVNPVLLPKVEGGGLSKEYTLDHLHFHWKSEHTVNSYRYPLEVHLVHYATEYHSLGNALKYKDGVAVLGVFYDLSPDDDDTFQPVITVMETVEKFPNVDRPIDKVKIASFLPRDTAGYYRYNGSLTTPNCTEAVTWTLFTNTIHISSNQVKHFQSVQAEGSVLKANYRSLQELKGRTVYQKVSPFPHSSANLISPTCIVLSVMFFLFSLIL